MDATNFQTRDREISQMTYAQAGKFLSGIMAGLSAAVGSPPPTQLKEWVNWLWIALVLDTLYGVMASFLLHENQSRKFSELLANKLLNYFIISSVATIICGIIDAWLPLSLSIWAIIANEVKSMLETALKLYKAGRYFWRFDILLERLSRLLDTSNPDIPQTDTPHAVVTATATATVTSKTE